MLAEVLEHCIVKVFYVVNYDVSRDTVAADDILPEEFFD
jgi:hypothetical protein